MMDALVVVPTFIAQLNISNLLLDRPGSVVCDVGSALRRLLDSGP